MSLWEPNNGDEEKSPEEQARERARDLCFEIDPPSDPFERKLVEDWLEGNIDIERWQEHDFLLDVIYEQRLRNNLN